MDIIQPLHASAMDIIQPLQDSATAGILVSVSLILAVTGMLISHFLSKPLLSRFPEIGGDIGDAEKRRMFFLLHGKKLYQEGYQRYKNGLFRLTGSDKTQTLVLSPRFLDELRKLPDATVSLEAAVRDTMEGRYTGSPGKGSLVVTPQTIKGDLNPALSRINPVLSTEVDNTVRQEMGLCSDWTSVNINNVLLRIVAIVSGRIFIGPELYRQDEYVEAATQYTVELLGAQRAVKAVKPWLRPIYAPFLPELKALERRVVAANRFLQPVVQARREAAARGEVKQHDDFLGWMMNNATKFDIKDDKEIARIQLAISFAAIHTTTMTTTNVFYNLAARREYVEPLREEIMQALDASGGAWTTQALTSLRKLDSFIRETMRLDPVFFNAFRRKVLRPFELSDGTHIPQNTMIEVPYYAITRDPSIFPDPDTFNGFRFSEIPEGKAWELNQFVSITPTNLLFGYGRHACPGRFFAANEIKMIVARVLLEYDFKNADGTTERYKNLEFGTTSVPDPKKELLFRRRAL